METFAPEIAEDFAADAPPTRPGGNGAGSGRKGPAAGGEKSEITTPDEEQDMGLATTLLRVAELLAAPLRPPAPVASRQQHLHFAAPEDRAALSAVPDDLSGLADLAARVRHLFAQDRKLARQAALVREALGDGEMLKIRFQQLFPAQKRRAPHLSPDGSPILSTREVDVLKEAAKDLGHEEIGRRLGITPRTVDTHLTRIYAKLHVQRPMQAVARAIWLGYLDADVLGFINGAGNIGPRGFTRFNCIANGASPMDRLADDASLRPLAEFALFLLFAVGAAAERVGEERGAAALRHHPWLICEVDPTSGRVLRSFGQGHLFGLCGPAVAPAHAARQGFTPGNLYVGSFLPAPSGLNKAAIHEFAPDGRYVRSLAGGRAVGTRLTVGFAPAFHPDGRLLMPSGALTDAVLAFRRGGQSVRRWAGDIVCGGVAVRGDEVYALHASSIGNHLRVYDESGRLRRTIGHLPTGASYAGMAVLPHRGHVWAVRVESLIRDGDETYTLVCYAADGTPLREIRLPGLGPGPVGLAADDEDRLCVPCARTGDVKVLSPEGKIVGQFDLRGHIAPQSVAIGEDGRLWVAGEVSG